MTKSTGKRERQKRREELFSAELKLRRVLLHLLEAHSWARRCCGIRRSSAAAAVLDEYQGRDLAFDIVRERLYRVRAEAKGLD